MKVTKYLFGAVCALAFTACHNSDEVTVTPDGVDGDNDEMISIIDDEYALSVSESNDNEVSIKVRVKLENDIEELKDVDNDDIDLGDGPNVIIYDGEGEELAKLELGNGSKNSTAKEEFKKFLKRDKGEKKDFTFTTELSGKNEMQELLKSAKTFKITDMSVAFPINVNMSGSIGQYGVSMTLHIDPSGAVTGAYYYTRKGPNALLYLKGTKDKDNLTLDEFDNNGKCTGDYNGTYDKGTFSGRFVTGTHEYQFKLTPDKSMKSINLAGINFDGYNRNAFVSDVEDSMSSDDYSTAGSSDWNSYLDTYERLVNKLISAYKKANNGDMTALAEYTSLMEEYDKLSDQMTRAEKDLGEMSAAQTARLTRLVTKMAQYISN